MTKFRQILSCQSLLGWLGQSRRRSKIVRSVLAKTITEACCLLSLIVLTASANHEVARIAVAAQRSTRFRREGGFLTAPQEERDSAMKVKNDV